MITQTNLVKVTTELKPGQRVVQIDGKWVLAGVGGMEAPSGGESGSMEIYKCASVDATSGTWSGYLYNEETKTFADTLTEGLAYNMVAPTVGKVYNVDASLLIDVYAQQGLVFYAPLHESKTTDEFGRLLSIPSGVEFTTLNNAKMAKFDNECITFDCSDFPTDGSRTLSCFARCDSVTAGYEVAAFGYGSASQYQAFLVGALREASGRYYFGSTYGGDISSEIAGTLVHLALSYCQETKILNFYIDGVLIGTQENLDLNTALQNGKIGSAMWNSMGWGGYISECKLWNRALSAEEIKTEADRCLAMVKQEEPVAALRCYIPLETDYQPQPTTGLTMTPYSAPTFTANQGVSSCAYFSGNFVNINIDYATAPLPIGSTARTIAAFIFPYSVKLRNIFWYGDLVSQQWFALYASVTQVAIDFCDNRPTFDIPLEYQAKWTHVAFTFDGDSLTCYIDGNLIGEVEVVGVNTAQRNGGLGARNGNTENYNGCVRELKVWEGCLTQTEVEDEAERCLALVGSDSGDSNTTSGTNLQIDFGEALPSFLGGTYIINDASATGTSRVWSLDGNSTYTIQYKELAWYACESDLELTILAHGDNPWDDVVPGLTVTIVE